jgi:hypothetical protein
MPNKVYTGTWDVIFHNQAEIAAQGPVVENPGYKTLVVSVRRDAGTSTVKFWAGLDSADPASLIALPGTPVSTTTTQAVSTTGTGELWRFDVSSLKYISMELDAASGAKVDVKGRFS